MIQIGHVEEIVAVKSLLLQCQEEGLIGRWELPYEQLLTRLSAAIFFFELYEESYQNEVENKFRDYPGLTIEPNHQSMSSLQYRMTLG